MPQKTDLDVSPYFDDFDRNKNFYKVLFKPGFPVQSRELTTLQSILQNQIESFGSHFFKDGTVVIPGNITYDSNYYAIKLNDLHLGLDIGIYLNNLIGKKIKGQDSQLTAIIQNVITKSESSQQTYTIYVKYLSSDSNYQISQFKDGEVLITLDTFKYGNTTINSGETFASLINSNASSIGSAVSISNGVYFIRGCFVNISENTLILDQYTNTPSYRIGLSVQESIEFASDVNDDLFDNARGFANFSAPGADRLKISTILTKKSLNDFDDKNFVELLRVRNGIVKKIQDSNIYSLISEYIAKRTYDESGDYAVIPFSVDVENSLNDRVSSNGIYFEGQRTDQNNVPSENLLSVKISPGKAYVKGFDIEKTETTILDVEKPRDTETIKFSSVPFEMGNLLKVNNVTGTPVIGIDNNYTVTLYNQRKNSTTSGNGNEIGKARVYSFGLSNNLYVNSSSQWDLYLFDVQTYTSLILNQSLNSNQCPVSSYIKGLSSGASGYVVSAPNSVNLTITQTSGSFSPDEQISINGITTLSRSIVSIKEYNTSDIKSVYQDSTAIGLSTDFVADAFLYRKIPTNFSNNDLLTITSSGIATCAGRNFSGISTNSIIRYQRSGFSTETFNRVSGVSTDGLTLSLSGITTVNGVCDGGLPTTTISVPFSIGSPSIKDENNAYLYAKLNNQDISNIDFTSSELKIIKQVKNKTTDNVGRLDVNLSDVGISEGFFETFDTERYSVFHSDGTVESLSSDKFSLDSSGTIITLSGLLPNKSNVTVNTTVRKNSIKNKQKIYLRSQKTEVVRTKSAISTSLSGLITSSYYGLRIEDEEISLNVPDVSKIIAIYESINNSSPILDSLNFSSGLNLDLNSILGEQIIGQTSGAVGQIVTKTSSTVVEFVYLNSNKFINGETVKFKESNIESAIETVGVGQYIDRTNEYILDSGQKEQYYDYSKIIKKNLFSVPSKKLLIIFDCYIVPSNDSGDVYTANSYISNDYKNIPSLNNGTKATDILDFRPRVSNFDPTITSFSPFDFSIRNFSTSGNNSPLVLSPNESSTIGYSYYLPRIDKLVLMRNGSFNLIKGISAQNPKEPSSIEDSMDIAILNLPAYLYDTKDIVVNLVSNVRYTMRDISSLEKRIEKLELSSSLSLLEIDTKSLQIQDSYGFNRFKSGFFVDNFKTNNFIEIKDADSKCIINKETEELTADISTYSLKSELGVSGNINIDTADFSTDLSLLDSNVKKTGDLVTLNYTEIPWEDLTQNFATKEQEINPSRGLTNYNGYVKLTPSSDTWARSLNSGNNSIVRTQGDWQKTFLDQLLLSTNPLNVFKEKNVQFYATGLCPQTQYYSFFDGRSNVDIIPKLLQVTMNFGSFQSGETVYGYFSGNKVCAFRLCNINHKTGTYNNPATTYEENPYSISLPLLNYSSSSSVINIDIYSLSNDAFGQFFGYVAPGMILIGKTSGAQATVNIQSLITDSVGDLIGSFFIRNLYDNSSSHITPFTVGTKTFKLSSSSSNSSSTSVSFTQNSFYASGIVNSSYYSNNISVRKPTQALPLNAQKRDPLSQTFRTDNIGGFVTSIDLYFSSKDTTEKLFVELRETDIGGVPKSNLIQDYARAEISPNNINISSDGLTPTNIKFPSPVYLEPNKQYAITLISPSSNKYKVWIAQTNEVTVDTQYLPNDTKVVYSNNYTGGNLYKPQNGSIWNPSLSEDLKFKLYKCNFTSTKGTVYFHNPNISVGSTTHIEDLNVSKLTNNPIKTLPRKLIVNITPSTNLQSILIPGTKVAEGNTYGYIENVGGSVSGITTSSVGAGYSNGTFTSVPLYNITGYGSSITANIVFANNAVSSISIANTGTGYVVGDVLGITTGSVTKGSGARITVSSIGNIDRMYLTNVQGETFDTNQPISYYVNSTQVSMASTVVVGTPYIPSNLYSGNIFEVSHYNHGMQANNNIVTIINVFPDSNPEPLLSNIDSSSLTISVASTSNFKTFEGIEVNSNNPGYVLINNEIISYTDVGTQSLTISQRGVSQSPIKLHSTGDLVYKYELNGISLNRINKNHTLSSNNTLKSLRGIDNYHIEFDRGNRGSGDNQINFINEKNVGGSECRASQNIQFNSIIPCFNVLTPANTTVSSSIRTISGTSVNGNETSFLDQNYEPITINDINYFNSPRLVCSRINEINKLSYLTNNKSLTLGISLSTNDSSLSPVIDTSESATFIFNRNRINKPIQNYAFDSRSNILSGDLHSSVYISKKVTLQQPANSLKVILTAYRHSSNDFRVFYKLFKVDSSEISQSYQLFPGYNNLIDKNGDGIKETIINVSLNDGLPDTFVRSSNENEFLEYEFTANDLGEFNGFVIKIVMSGTNESYAPRFKDLRALALV